MSEQPADAFASDVCGASVLLLGCVVWLVIFRFAWPPNPDQLAAADPLLQLVHAHGGLGLVPVLCALPALSWCVHRPPDRAVLRRALHGLLLGVAVAWLGLLLLRLVLGPSLPSFVPPEESARPGLVLGFGAGLLEEAVFRLGMAAPLYMLLTRITSSRSAACLAILLSGLAFAGAHELGPGALTFELRHFVVRLLVPGCAFSALFFRPGPAFLVSCHAAAHIGIALLFTGGSR